MQLLAHLTLPVASQEKRLELLVGDLTQPTPDQASDIVVVSAYPGQYFPSPRDCTEGDEEKLRSAAQRLSGTQAL
jgi:hypothetical protein